MKRWMLKNQHSGFDALVLVLATIVFTRAAEQGPLLSGVILGLAVLIGGAIIRILYEILAGPYE